MADADEKISQLLDKIKKLEQENRILRDKLGNMLDLAHEMETLGRKLDW